MASKENVKKLTDEEEMERIKEQKKAEKALKKQLKKDRALAKKLESDRTQIRLKLGREQKLDAITYEKATKDWEQMLVNIKQIQLKEDLKGTWIDLTQSLDRKENLIHRLLGDQEKAEEQFKRSVAKHYDFIDYAIKLYELLCNSMRAMYEDEADTVINAFHKECVYKERIHTRQTNYFENLLHATNAVTKNVLDMAASDFMLEKENFSNKSIEKRETLRDNIVKGMTDLYRQMQEAVKLIQSTSTTPSRVQTYKRLVARETADELEFARVRRSTAECRASIARLTEELEQTECDNTERLAAMRREKEYFIECFLTLRSRYEEEMRLDGEQLRLLVDSSYVSVTKLTEQERKGSLILAITAVCRKLQTEKEKILPWPDSTLGGDKDVAPVPYEEAMDTIGHLSQMENFWQRSSMANTQCLELAEEKKTLTEYNEYLRNLIRQYCDQQKYNSIIASLRICPYPTVTLPLQEAAHMPQIRKNCHQRKK